MRGARRWRNKRWTRLRILIKLNCIVTCRATDVVNAMHGGYLPSPVPAQIYGDACMPLQGAGGGLPPQMGACNVGPRRIWTGQIDIRHVDGPAKHGCSSSNFEFEGIARARSRDLHTDVLMYSSSFYWSVNIYIPAAQLQDSHHAFESYA